jgi:serine/threonine-protein kinase
MGRLIDAFGGAEALDSPAPRVVPVYPASGQESSDARPIPLGIPQASDAGATCDVKLLLASRYELDAEPFGPLPGRLVAAFDRASKQNVTLAFPGSEARVTDPPGDLHVEVTYARSVSHPNVCRVHDAITTPWGPAFVTEAIAGRTLEGELVARLAAGRDFPLEEFRHIATDCYAGLAAIHARGLVHGNLTAAHIVLFNRKTVLLCLGLSRARESEAGETAERRTPANDVFALACCLWSMWSVGRAATDQPRARPLRAQVKSEVPQRLSADELRNLFRSLSPDPAVRPLARRVRFHVTRHTPTATLFAREHIDPGPPETSEAFIEHRHALLVTYSGTAPELVGTLLPLSKRSLTFGRSPRADISVPERTVSTVHASLTWQKTGWTVEDLGSTNGTYAGVGYDRQRRILLRHGAEVQLGELRVLLVGFEAESRRHRRAREYLSRRDGLTGLLGRELFRRELDEDGALADWAELPMQVVVYELSAPTGEKQSSIIGTMLALRHTARRAVEMTEATTVALCAVPAGIINIYRPRVDASPPQFGVSLVGVEGRHARHMAEAIADQLRGTLPPGFMLQLQVMGKPPGMRPRFLLDEASFDDPITIC